MHRQASAEPECVKILPSSLLSSPSVQLIAKPSTGSLASIGFARPPGALSGPQGQLRLLTAPSSAEFAKQPLACLTLASFLTTNAGDVARRHIRDPELLRFIDIECYCWSTVPADLTPMINAGMVFCDRHYGGINYPRGGVGNLGELLAQGLQEQGSHIEYQANVSPCWPAQAQPVLKSRRSQP